MNPVIKKADEIIGNSCLFKNATVADAEFIMNLRLEPRNAAYLSETSSNIQDQINYLKKYQEANNQAYFVIYDKKNNKVGTVRLYDAVADSFSWGSLILAAGTIPTISIETVLIVYSYGLNYLGFKEAHFEVRKDNHSVISFHKSFGAEKYDEKGKEYLFRISNENILKSLERFKKFLPKGIEVKE